jgi:hypothetical protein
MEEAESAVTPPIPEIALTPSPIDTAVSDTITALQHSQIKNAIEEATAIMRQSIARGQLDGRMTESEGIEAFRDSAEALSRATQGVDVKQELIEAARQVDFNPAVQQIVHDVRRGLSVQETQTDVDRPALSVLSQVAAASEASLATMDVNPAVQETLRSMDINGMVAQMLDEMRQDLGDSLDKARSREHEAQSVD